MGGKPGLPVPEFSPIFLRSKMVQGTKNKTIKYTIAENVQKAMICIYDMNGTQLNCIPLNLNGYGNITINGSELKAGMYIYTLIADGQLIDKKRMVLTY